MTDRIEESEESVCVRVPMVCVIKFYFSSSAQSPVSICKLSVILSSQ